MHVVRKLVFCSVQRFMKGLRGDLVPEPHFVVDIAVQAEFSQFAFSSISSAQTIPASTKKTQYTQTELP